ncbi:MAG: tectonin domain-containing protein [Caldilineaceae bacterium]
MKLHPPCKLIISLCLVFVLQGLTQVFHQAEALSMFRLNSASILENSPQTTGSASWIMASGFLKHISVSCDNAIWGINSDDQIFRRDENGWTLIDGRLKQISVGNVNNIWGINSDDQIFRRDENGWTLIDGRLKHISVGCDNMIWGVNSDDQIFRRDKNGWTLIDGRLKQISVGNANNIWGVNSNDQIFRRDKNGWTLIDGLLKYVSVADDGTVWGVNVNDQIFRYNGNSWTVVEGLLKQISVGNASNIWGVNTGDQIFALAIPLKRITELDRSQLGIGAVEDGIGSSIGAGYYNVRIWISSPMRFNVYTNDSGEENTFCFTPDLPNDQCFYKRKFDGNKLEPHKFWVVRGLEPYLSGGVRDHIGKIEGPFQNWKGAWEWPDTSFTDYGYWTFRKTVILDFEYRDIYWSGYKSQADSVIRVEWKESDPGASDDHSQKADFLVGDMIHKCLQSGGEPGKPVTLLPDNAGYSWNLDSNIGNLTNAKSSRFHYRIQVFYSVQCVWESTVSLMP